MCGLWDAAPALWIRSFLSWEPLAAGAESFFGRSAAFASSPARHCARECRTAGAGARIRDGMVGIGNRTVNRRLGLRTAPPNALPTVFAALGVAVAVRKGPGDSW